MQVGVEEYTVRPVSSDDEVVAWGALCARGFSHRPGAASRFYDKYCADPTASRLATRVVAASDGQLVGSVRVFDRTWEVGGAAVSVAGLGEVCTDPDFRGRGISRIMLVDAVQYCEWCTPAGVSALHAAAAVAPLYAQYGYRSAPIPYAALTRSAACSDDDGVYRLRGVADVAAEWRQLAALHTAAVARLGVVGTTVRDAAYWTRWMPHVLADQAVVLERCVDAAGAAWQAVAYAAIVKKADGFKLIDFGMADDA